MRTTGTGTPPFRATTKGKENQLTGRHANPADAAITSQSMCRQLTHSKRSSNPSLTPPGQVHDHYVHAEPAEPAELMPEVLLCACHAH
jgi:hypothetical protein